MNGNRTLKIAVAALLGAGSVAGQAVLAQQPDFEEWQCRFCPFPDKGLEGTAGVSAVNVSDDSARFGNYTGLDEEGFYPNADAELIYRAGDGYAVTIDAVNLGLDARSLDISAGRQGSWVVDLSWDELPVRKDDTGQTIYGGLGSSSLTLPPGWVRSGFTSGMTALDASLRPLTLGWDRQTLGLGFEFVQSRRLRYEADWTRQTKEGQGLTWGSFLGNAADLTKPLDYQTDQVDAGVVYAGRRGSLRLGYYGSFFSNKNIALGWQNPFLGPEAGSAAQAPDNRFSQVLLQGNYLLDTWDTVVNATYAWGRMEQTDALLPYTINPAVPSLPLPVSEFDGRADTTSANLRVTSRPADRLRVSAEYRYNERDNKSGQYLWQPVQADSFTTLPFMNPAYSFENTDLALRGDYRFSRMLQGSAGWWQKVRKRDDQNVDRTEEDAFWGELRFRPMGMLALSLKGETATRDASEYRAIPSTGAGAEQNPLLRKYYLADRDRNSFRAKADFSPTERGSLSVRYETARDRYTESVVGLVAADYDQVSADFSALVWKELVFSAYFSRENYDSETVGAGTFAVPNTAPPNWRGRSDDRHDVQGIALNWPGLASGKLDLRADWSVAETTGNLNIENPLDVPATVPFPTLRSKLTGTQLTADWHLNDRWTINAGWRWEKYSADDWALDGVGPGTIANVLTFGGTTQDYDVDVFLLGFTYRFAVQKPEE